MGLNTSDMMITDLGVTRGGIPVLDGVSFCVRMGGAVILRGPNGIGKTTLLRTLAGLQPARRGDNGIDAEMVAYGAHADGIKANLTVAENLTFWADVFGTHDIEPAIAAFDLDGLRGRVAGALSAGQKRRLGLARLVITGREVWILDEPTVSLDTGAVAMFVAAIRAHLAAGGRAIIATHIDLGLDEADVLDIAQFRARAAKYTDSDADFDEVFL